MSSPAPIEFIYSDSVGGDQGLVYLASFVDFGQQSIHALGTEFVHHKSDDARGLRVKQPYVVGSARDGTHVTQRDQVAASERSLHVRLAVSSARLEVHRDAFVQPRRGLGSRGVEPFIEHQVRELVNQAVSVESGDNENVVPVEGESAVEERILGRIAYGREAAVGLCATVYDHRLEVVVTLQAEQVSDRSHTNGDVRRRSPDRALRPVVPYYGEVVHG